MYFPSIDWELLSSKLSITDQKLSFIDSNRWFLSFSGGADSVMVLFFLVAYHQKINKLRHLEIFFLDHEDQTDSAMGERMRIIHSLLDLVKGIQNLTVNFSHHKLNVKAISARYKNSFEYTASRLRQKIRERYHRQYPDTVFFTGHNLSDWLETVILRMNRGTYPENLRPLDFIQSPCSAIHCHPLYLSTRKEVRSFLDSHGISYWDDPQNQNLIYARNRVREKIGIDNKVGFRMTALNFLRQFPHPEIMEHHRRMKAQVIVAHREIRIPTMALDHSSEEEKLFIVNNTFRCLGLYPLSSHIRTAMKSHPFFYGPYSMEIENWNQTLYYTFRRGRKQIFPLQVKENFISGTDITKHHYIHLMYGRKKISKIFSEKRLSQRQRGNLLMEYNPDDPREILSVMLNIFGLKDYFSTTKPN